MPLISVNQFRGEFDSAYKREGVDSNDMQHYDWAGYCLAPINGSAASLDVIIPSQVKVQPDLIGLVLPPGAIIRQLGFRVLKPVVLGAATGKLKLATALNASVTSTYCESSAAVAGVINAMPYGGESSIQNMPSVPFGNTTPVTFKLFATDGGAGGAAASSAVASGIATARVKILVRVQFSLFRYFPSEKQVGYSSSDRI